MKQLRKATTAATKLRLGNDTMNAPHITVRSNSELLSKRRRHLGPSLSVSYRDPVKIVRGAG